MDGYVMPEMEIMVHVLSWELLMDGYGMPETEIMVHVLSWELIMDSYVMPEMRNNGTCTVLGVNNGWLCNAWNGK